MSCRDRVGEYVHCDFKDDFFLAFLESIVGVNF